MKAQLRVTHQPCIALTPEPAAIALTDHTRGEDGHVQAARDYIAQLNANREATPVPEPSSKEGSET